ncbi:hypothetical protein [Flavobacterium sp.]|uniref:hypothetical protein n=1 Tax=Flavobacterium sp. TaxID=239 RepID=UPI0025CB9325|nr:hypothetical protein [Flavobacterium sp.]
MKIDQKLELIFEFLKSNRKYNHKLQEKFYNSVVKSFDNNSDKIISLLYHIANTQSQPKIDSLSVFYKKIHANSNCLNSFKDFVEFIKTENKVSINFKGLYLGMMNQSGWGKKTSALFSKIIFHLHNGDYSNNLKIWNDVPKTIEDTDDFFLPVDSVIISIFKKLDTDSVWNFDNINKLLKKNYNNSDIEVWDDLWFWGFITQNGSGDNRIFEWNENKYWNLKDTDKNEFAINEIKLKAKNFLKLL